MKKTYIIPTMRMLLTQQVLDEGITLHQSMGDPDNQLSDDAFFDEEDPSAMPTSPDVWQ